MSFRDKVKAAGIEHCYKKGLQALEKRHRHLVSPTNTRKLSGSVFIEQCLGGRGRWDYAIGYDDQVYFLEVHPADNLRKFREIKEKAQWLCEWKANTPFKEDNRLFWVATGKVLSSKNPRSQLDKMKAKLQKDFNLVGPLENLRLPYNFRHEG